MNIFFDECNVEGSSFSTEYALLNSEWQILNSIYQTDKKTSNPIPNYLHFIWLGSKLPEIYANNIEDWSIKNPDLKLQIWNDESAEEIMKTSPQYDLYMRTKNFGIKSDILRYQILHSIGGIYADTDFLCLSDAFSRIASYYSFFGVVMFDKYPTISNGIIGSSTGNPILKECIDNASDKTYANIRCPQTRVLYQTGPFLLTKAVFNNIHTNMRIYPTSFFFPFPATQRHNATKELVASYIKKHSLACHLWHCSWQPDSKFYVGNN